MFLGEKKHLWLLTKWLGTTRCKSDESIRGYIESHGGKADEAYTIASACKLLQYQAEKGKALACVASFLEACSLPPPSKFVIVAACPEDKMQVRLWLKRHCEGGVSCSPTTCSHAGNADFCDPDGTAVVVGRHSIESVSY